MPNITYFIFYRTLNYTAETILGNIYYIDGWWERYGIYFVAILRHEHAREVTFISSRFRTNTAARHFLAGAGDATDYHHGSHRLAAESAVNSLAPGRCGSYFKCVISEHMFQIKLINTSCEIALTWTQQNPWDGWSTFIQVMAWSRQVSVANWRH